MVRRSIEDRIWCFVGPGSEDPSEGFSGPGGAADSESRGGPSEGRGEGGEGSEVAYDPGSDRPSIGADRTGTVDDPAYGTVDTVTTNDDGSMTGVENFGPDDLPEDFAEFIGIEEGTELFGTQDTTGTAAEGGFAFSTNTPLSREAMTWIAAAMLPFGGALKALGVLGPFHPDEHIPSSIRAEIDEFIAFLSGDTGDLTPEQEEEMRKKYFTAAGHGPGSEDPSEGFTGPGGAADNPSRGGPVAEGVGEDKGTSLEDHGFGEGGDGVNEDTGTDAPAEPPPPPRPSTLGGYEIYVNGGFQVNYRAVEHVMRGVGEINFTTDAIRQLLEPPPGIGLEGGIPVYPLPATMDAPEEVTLETYPPPGASVDVDREPKPGHVSPDDVVSVEPPEPTLPPVIAY